MDNWVYSTKKVVNRKAFIKYENGKYSFLIDNWFDDIDGFTKGLYAKVRLGRFCNLVTPLGEYLFPNWFADIEFHGNNLIFCYYSRQIKTTSPNGDPSARVCSIFDKKGNILLADVTVKSTFMNGKSVILKSGLFNYIDVEGQLLMDTWLTNAQVFDKTPNGIFAFVKTENGWGVINQQGTFVYSPQFSSIRGAKCNVSRNGYSPIAIVEDDKGQNLLMSKNKCDKFILGLEKSVDAIALIGDFSRILVEQNGRWGIFEWRADKYRDDCAIDLGELDSVGDELYQVQGEYCRLIQKDSLFNVVYAGGLVFREWYSEIVIVGNLFRVKRRIDTSNQNIDSGGNESRLFYEYNLAKFDGSYILQEWRQNMVLTPFQGVLLININPAADKSSQHYCSGGQTRIEKIQGTCNIISGGLLFKNWYDGLEFLDEQIFTEGYLKVWKDGKCNLIDEAGNYVSSEWMDDFLASRNSYYCYLKAGAFEVKRENKVNLLYNGRLVFNQWFDAIIGRRNYNFLNSRTFSIDIALHDGEYYVQTGNQYGVYSLESGLLGNRLFDYISKISETLYFSISDNLGHIMSREGAVLTTAPIFEVYPFKNGYAVVTNDRSGNAETFQYNFIDSVGQLVSPIWFDGNRYDMSFDYSDGRQPSPFIIVRKDSKYNLITPDKKLVFKKWYDSISGVDDKWLISDESRGEMKFNFIDNNEGMLSKEWFKGAWPLGPRDNGVFIVENETGLNIFNSDNKLSLSCWTKDRIYYDDFSGLAIITDREVLSHYYYLDCSGHLITDFGNWSYEEPHKSCYRYHNADLNEDLLILNLYDDEGLGGYMQILCKRDGTPFFKKDVPRSRLIHHATDDSFSNSIFGSIKEYSTPEKKSLLLVNKHWPVKNGDKGEYVIIDYGGRELSEVFESIGTFNKDGFAVVKKNEQFNLLTKDFRILSSLWFSNLGFQYKSKETKHVEEFHRNTSFHNGFLKVELSGLFNLINKAGKLQFSIWYDSLIILPYGYYRVELNGLFNIVDASNQPVSDVWFDRMTGCKRDSDEIIYGGWKGNLARLLFLRESSVILSDDWFDVIAKYDKYYCYYPVRRNGKKNFVTDKGKLFVPGWHDDQLLFNDYVVIKDGDKYNIYSGKSNLLTDVGFDNVLRSKNGYLFNYGWCGVQVDGKYTFINENGLLADGRFDSIREYKFGFAGVVLGEKKNYLTAEGKLLTNIWFDEISAFNHFKMAAVKIDGKLNVIDSTGSLLLNNLQDVSSIEKITSEYCLLSFNSENGKTIKRYYDFKTSQLHNSEKDVKDYLESLKTDDNPIVAKRNKQISQLIEKGGRQGLNYTVINFGNKSNLVDKGGNLVFEEWINRIEMYQGVPFIQNGDNKWIIIK